MYQMLIVWCCKKLIFRLKYMKNHFYSQFMPSSYHSMHVKWKFKIFFSFIFISWRLITLQYCSRFCHTLTWISHGLTCVPHPNLPSHLPLYPIPLGLPSAPGPSTCLMYPTCWYINRNPSCQKGMAGHT